MRETTRYLVLFAVPQEAKFFQRAIGKNPEVEIVVTGMGAKNAKQAIEHELQNRAQTLEAVLTCGFAGGLNDTLSFGEIGYSSDDDFPLTQSLLKSNARSIRFHCSQTVVSFAKQKRALRLETGADGVEMESQIIRDVCKSHGIPSATVRVISDAVDEDLPLDFGALMTENSGIDFPKLMLQLIKKPQKIFALLRFSKKIKAASKKLSDCLVGVLSD